VLAIAGLLAARFYGWTWLDPVIGIVGAVVIARWSWGLIHDFGRRAARRRAQPRAGRGDPRQARDRSRPHRRLHVWRLGPATMRDRVAGRRRPEPVERYKERLGEIAGSATHGRGPSLHRQTLTR